MVALAPLLINDWPEELRAAERYLQAALARHSGRPVVLFGAGETGRAVLLLLRSLGVTVQAVFDDAKEGRLETLTIERDRARLPLNAVVLVAIRRPLRELQELLDWLESRGHPVLHCSGRRGPHLSDFAGRHRGETAFIIGSGPSLSRTPLAALSGRLTFGCNRLYLGLERFGLSLRYWTIEDPLVAEDTAPEWTCLAGPQRFLPEDLLWLEPDVESVCPVPFRRHSFEPELPRFGTTAGALYWGGTVTYLMLQLAALMGCVRLVLLGIDFSYERPAHVRTLDHPERWQSHGPDPNHFDPNYYGPGRKWHDPRVDRMHLAYQAARAHAERAGIEILNATPGTRLDVFRCVPLEACL